MGAGWLGNTRRPICNPCGYPTYIYMYIPLAQYVKPMCRRFEDYGAEDLMAIMREAARSKYGWQLGYPEVRRAWGLTWLL